MVVDELTSDEADRVFQALADATRRDILARTMRQGESVSELSRRYAMSFAAVQKHVAVLQRAALVTKEKRGREQIVHADAQTLRRAAGLLDAYEQIWIGRAARIADILASEDDGDDGPGRRHNRRHNGRRHGRSADSAAGNAANNTTGSAVSNAADSAAANVVSNAVSNAAGRTDGNATGSITRNTANNIAGEAGGYGGESR